MNLNKMKKIFAIILAIAMVFSVSACGAADENTSSAVSTVETIVSKPEYDVSSVVSELESDVSDVVSETVSQNFDIKLTFLGDMILANQRDISPKGRFEEYAEKNPPEYFLSKVKDILSADDFTVANLESTLSDRELTPREKNYSPAFWFKGKTSNVNVLTAGSVEAVLLTNNHIMDYGQEGFNDTVNAVTNAGLKYGTNDNTLYFEKNGFKIAVICAGIWSQYETGRIVNRIKAAEQNSHFQVVFFHGGTEKVYTPEQYIVNAAHTFVDNGADLVVGGHPHVLQPREIYKDAEIVYSVGNFCYGGALRPENRTIIYQYTLNVNPETLNAETQSSNIIPCYVYTESINNYQPAPITNEAQKQKVLDYMDGKTDSPI